MLDQLVFSEMTDDDMAGVYASLSDVETLHLGGTCLLTGIHPDHGEVLLFQSFQGAIMAKRQRAGSPSAI